MTKDDIKIIYGNIEKIEIDKFKMADKITILEILGIKYSTEFFEAFSNQNILPLDTPFVITKREDGAMQHIKKINLNEGDILLMPNIFSTEYRQIIQQEIAITYPGKNIGIMFVDDPSKVRVIKPDGIK